MTTVTSEKKKTSFFREVQNELKKVTWTTKEELIFSTKTVILSTIVVGFAIYGFDLVVRGVFQGVGNLFRMIFG
jgi:preprotein translocase SecE subunit